VEEGLSFSYGYFVIVAKSASRLPVSAGGRNREVRAPRCGLRVTCTYHQPWVWEWNSADPEFKGFGHRP